MRRRRWPRRWESSRASSRAWHASSPRPRAVSRWRAGSRPSTRAAPPSWRRRTSSTTSRARSARRSSSGRTTASGGRGRGRSNRWPTSCPTWRQARSPCCSSTARTRHTPCRARSRRRSPRSASRSASRPTAMRRRPVRLASGVAQLTATPPALAGGPGETVLTVFPSIGLYDGRGANKPWLQELPDPVSKITWHAWVEVHPATAARWGLTNGDFLLLKSPYGAVKAPVWITPGVRPDVLAAATGQGHTAYGRYAKDRSGNAFELLSSAPNGYGGRTFSVAVSVVKTGEHRRLATAEGDPRELGAHNVEVLPLGRARQLKSGERAFEEHEAPAYAERALEDWAAAQHEKASLGNYAGEHPRWGLAIDLATCTGCSACVTACYAENNIATVGEELVVRRRVMGWMRVERYYTGGDHGEPVGAVVTPMLCQQCGNAPCEPVCPVYAAYHTADGLNGQVYNRCIGTRYCSNNCPYKVRYFNWYNFAEQGGEWESWPAPLDMLLNPDVTVREKGVMEKCTFCVQRIRGAQNRARLEDRTVRDGEIVPACAQACPSEAIVFGDLHDRRSRVSELAQDPRGYHVLAGLNTKPAITYLRSEEHTSELQSRGHLVCRLLLEKK